ncbi:hypothetical protein HDV05_006653 [Chytridiales sp. JEL 0842]|nr:hypothetical protein HDV05_006653 [Chytridiales sp. JEL 0842]
MGINAGSKSTSTTASPAKKDLFVKTKNTKSPAPVAMSPPPGVQKNVAKKNSTNKKDVLKRNRWTHQDLKTLMTIAKKHQGDANKIMNEVGTKLSKTYTPSQIKKKLRIVESGPPKQLNPAPPSPVKATAPKLAAPKLMVVDSKPATPKKAISTAKPMEIDSKPSSPKRGNVKFMDVDKPAPKSAPKSAKAQEGEILWIMDRRVRKGRNEYLLLRPGQDVFEGKWHHAEDFKHPSDLEKIAQYDEKWGATPAPYEPTPGLLGSVWDFVYDSAVMFLFGAKESKST